MLAAGSGTFGLSNSYNVNYTTMSSTSGFELNGTGLNNITIDVLNGNTVSLASNLVVNGTLSLTSGTLVLSDFNLTLNGNIASIGNGDISSNNNSNITINGTNSVAGALVFNGTSNAVNNFTINLGAMNILNLGGTLLVQGTLSLNSGTLVFNTANLTIAGSFLGAGFLSGNSASNLSITTPGGLSTALNFAPLGQMLNNFRLAIQGSNSVLLGSNLTLSGDLTLEAGSALNLNGNVLTIDTTSKIIITGGGTIIVNPSSGLIINSHGLVSSAINFSGIIGMFTLNTNALDVITLGNNLNVSSMLNLTNGQLKLDNNDLTISGDISGGGAGIIHSTIGSNISVSSANTPAGALRFATLAKSVNNLNISIGANGHIKLGSDLIIAGILNFISGSVNMGSNSINFGTAGSITGANANAYIITDGIGFLGMPLISGSAGGPTLFPIGTTSNYAPANIELNAASPSGILMATVTPMVFSNGTSGVDLSATQPLVNATWHFESDILANIDMNLGLMWSANMEVNGFNRNKSYLSQNESGVWDNSISGAASQTGGMYAMQRNHLMALNRFAIFDSSAITPVIEMSNLSGFQLYVNPSAENINIKKSNNSNELVYIDILNNLGQIVLTTSITKSEINVAINSLSAGTYFVKIYNQHLNEVKKFSKAL